MTYQDVVQIPISHLVHKDGDWFWWKDNGKFDTPIDLSELRVGSIFVDGNNGDTWKVLAADIDNCRVIVQNKTQGGTRFVYWDELI